MFFVFFGPCQTYTGKFAFAAYEVNMKQMRKCCFHLQTQLCMCTYAHMHEWEQMDACMHSDTHSHTNHNTWYDTYRQIHMHACSDTRAQRHTHAHTHPFVHMHEYMHTHSHARAQAHMHKPQHIILVITQRQKHMHNVWHRDEMDIQKRAFLTYLQANLLLMLTILENRTKVLSCINSCRLLLLFS